MVGTLLQDSATFQRNFFHFFIQITGEAHISLFLYGLASCSSQGKSVHYARQAFNFLFIVIISLLNIAKISTQPLATYVYG